MGKNKNTRTTSISEAQTIEEIADFWDENSLADHWDATEQAEFEVHAKSRHRVRLLFETD